MPQAVQNFFAFGAVSLLDRVLAVLISFVLEVNAVRLKSFFSLAQFLLEEPASFKEALQASLKSGLSYPAAPKKSSLADTQRPSALQYFK